MIQSRGLCDDDRFQSQGKTNVCMKKITKKHIDRMIFHFFLVGIMDGVSDLDEENERCRYDKNDSDPTQQTHLPKKY